MPHSTVESTFGVRTLTTAIRTFDDQARDKILSDIFAKKGRKIRVEGRKAEWEELRASRALAPVVGLTSPAPKVELKERRNRDSALILTKVSKDIEWDRLFLDRAAGEMRPNAQAVIADELADLRGRIHKTREYVCAKICQGGVTINSTNIPGSDQTFTLDFSTNAYTRTAAWSNAATLILSDEIPRIQEDAVQTSGLPVMQAVINDKTYRYLLKNTEIQSFGKNERFAENFLRASVVDPMVLRGIKVGDVDFVSDPFGYQNDGGSFTRWVADDTGIFLPGDADLEQVLGYAEAEYPVPGDLWGPGGDAGIDMLGPGLVAWAARQPTGDPPIVTIYAALRFLPVIMFPEAVINGSL